MKKRYKVFFALSLAVITTIATIIFVRPIYINHEIKNEQIAIKKYGVSARAYFYWCGENGSYENFCKQLPTQHFKFAFSDHDMPMPFINDKIPAASNYTKKSAFDAYSVEYNITGCPSLGGYYIVDYTNKNIKYEYTSNYGTGIARKSKTMDIYFTNTTTGYLEEISINLFSNKAIIDSYTPPDLIKSYNAGDYNDTIKSLVNDAEKQLN